MAKTLTRSDLSEAVYQELGLSRNESAALVERVLDEVVEALLRDEQVKLSSFGTFMVRAAPDVFPVALGKAGVNVRLVEQLVDAKVELVQSEEGQAPTAPTREAGETHEESTDL